MPSQEVLAMDKFSKSLRQLDDEITRSLDAYLGRQHINHAAVVGVLELQKARYFEFVSTVKNKGEFKVDKDPPSYVG